MLTLLSKGVPTKWLKFFWLKIFFICHRCQRHRWSTLSCEYLCDFWKKFEMVLMGYSGAGGKLIHKRNQKQKISWHCPFKKELKSIKYHKSNKSLSISRICNSSLLSWTRMYLHLERSYTQLKKYISFVRCYPRCSMLPISTELKNIYTMTNVKMYDTVSHTLI